MASKDRQLNCHKLGPNWVPVKLGTMSIVEQRNRPFKGDELRQYSLDGPEIPGISRPYHESQVESVSMKLNYVWHGMVVEVELPPKCLNISFKLANYALKRYQFQLQHGIIKI